MKRLIAILMSLAMLLTFSLTALADDQTQTPGLDKQIQKLQELKKVQPIRDEVKTIRDLHKQINEVRKQIHTQYNQLRPMIKQARQAKNYDALITALTGLKQVKADLIAIKGLSDKNKGVWDQMRGQRENKDLDGALNNLKIIEANVRAKLDAYNKGLTDLNKVIADLNAALAKQPAQTVPAK